MLRVIQLESVSCLSFDKMKVCGVNSQVQDLFIVSSESLYVCCYNSKGAMHLDVSIEVWSVIYKQNSQLKVTRVWSLKSFVNCAATLERMVEIVRENGLVNISVYF